MRDNPAIQIVLAEELDEDGRRQFVKRAPSRDAKDVDQVETGQGDDAAGLLARCG